MDLIKKLLTSINTTIKWFFIITYAFVFMAYVGLISAIGYGGIKEAIKIFNPPPAEETT